MSRTTWASPRGRSSSTSGPRPGLFFEAYKRAVTSLPAWLDAPQDVLDEGFFATLMYWLERTEHLIHEDWIPYRVALIGNYGTDLGLKRDINRFLVSEDPYGTLEFVEFGIERGEVRDDIDLEMIVSMVDWLAGSLQDALVTEELDPVCSTGGRSSRSGRRRASSSSRRSCRARSASSPRRPRPSPERR